MSSCFPELESITFSCNVGVHVYEQMKCYGISQVINLTCFHFLMIIQEKLKKSQLERDQAVKGVKQDEGKTAGGRRQGDL